MMAYGRLVDAGTGAARFELLIQDAPRQSRVLYTRNLGESDRARPDLTELTPAWSPDGRYLAIADLKAAPGLSVIRADNGRLIKSIDGAASPAWSPDGSRLAYVQVDRVSSLHVIESNFGPPRYLAALGQTYGTPGWSRDSKSVLAVARRVVDGRRIPSQQVDLLRASIDSGAIEIVANVGPDPNDLEKPFRGVCFTIDRDGEVMFSSANVDGQAAAIVWYHPTTQETTDRFNPVDISVRIGALALSPNGKTLAIRFGWPSDGTTTALWNLETRKLTPIAADDPSRLEWLSLLLTTARPLLQISLPPAAVEGRAVERPTLLAVPGEIPPNHEVLMRLRRLGRYGRPLCDRPEGAVKGDARLEAYLAECRLFFDALREDYPGALASVAALDSLTTEPDGHLRLLAVRAQLLLGMGDFDRVSDPIAYLESLDAVKASRYEITPGGPILIPEPTAISDWARYLAARVADAEKSKRAGSDREEEGLGHRNPDAPMAPHGEFQPFGANRDEPFFVPREIPMPPPLAPDAGGPPLRFRRGGPARVAPPPPPGVPTKRAIPR